MDPSADANCRRRLPEKARSRNGPVPKRPGQTTLRRGGRKKRSLSGGGRTARCEQASRDTQSCPASRVFSSSAAGGQAFGPSVGDCEPAPPEWFPPKWLIVPCNSDSCRRWQTRGAAGRCELRGEASIVAPRIADPQTTAAATLPDAVNQTFRAAATKAARSAHCTTSLLGKLISR